LNVQKSYYRVTCRSIDDNSLPACPSNSKEGTEAEKSTTPTTAADSSTTQTDSQAKDDFSKPVTITMNVLFTDKNNIDIR